MNTSTLLAEAPAYWEISDERWEAIRALLRAHDPPRATGRRRIDQRAALNAMIYRARTGCRWNKLPSHLPDDSSVHRTMQRWIKLGVLAEIWQIVLAPGVESATPGAAPAGAPASSVATAETLTAGAATSERPASAAGAAPVSGDATTEPPTSYATTEARPSGATAEGLTSGGAAEAPASETLFAAPVSAGRSFEASDGAAARTGKAA